MNASSASVYRSHWAFDASTDPVSRMRNLTEARAAMKAVDWNALPDFTSVMDAGRDANWLGLGTPPRLGGLGLTPREICLLYRDFERIDTDASHSVGYANSLGVLPLLFSGQPVFDELIAGIASGREFASFVLTEPQGGSHMRGMQAFARPVEGGFRLSGTKGYIAHAQAATWLLVAARQGSDFHTFVVPRSAPGVKLTRSVHPEYMPRIYVNDLSFDDVFVPQSHVIEDPKVVYDSMMITRTYILAGKIGHIERCLDRLLPFASERRISTGLMVDNVAVQRRIRHLMLSIEALSGLLELALAEEEAHGCAYELAMAGKILGVDLALEASSIMQGLMGARGVDPSTGIPRAADDVKNWRIMDGAPEPMQHFLAVNYMMRKPFLAGLGERFPDAFARLPRGTVDGDTDMTMLGSAVAWALARASAQANGSLTDMLAAFMDRALTRRVEDALGYTYTRFDAAAQ